jgi:AraC-like DNA-binding protein
MNAHLVDGGVLLGLSDDRLSKAIEAMHKHPEVSWSLEELAQCAGMSRARFAVHFRKVVGTTPFDYLTNWRLGIAQTKLRKGNSLKLIAAAVGYTHATALTRIFTQRLGVSPSDWLAGSKPEPVIESRAHLNPLNRQKKDTKYPQAHGPQNRVKAHAFVLAAVRYICKFV